ncbi:MAG TPA: maleylacetoacetate isomerase, partial [Burkholderiaceae bacterium]
MKLYSYFRSSASYRVRIALNLKGLPYETVPVHLLNNGGEQLAPSYRALNPDGVVPSLESDGSVLTQSLAIIEYLEETHPAVPLLPADPLARAYVRAVALSIACEIHPVNNLRILKYLSGTLKVSEDDKNAWYRHWCEEGLQALEQLVVNSGRAGKFVLGDAPGLADCFL